MSGKVTSDNVIAILTILFNICRRSVPLIVQFAPEVQVSSHPTRLVEGDTVHFVCQATANPPKLQYRFVSSVQYNFKLFVRNYTLSLKT